MEPTGGGGGDDGAGDGDGDGEVPLSPDASASACAGSEDRLGALPDDILLLILRHLSTRAAAQTSVLSRRWRRVWALLPCLHFRFPPDPHQIGRALQAHEAAIRSLYFWTLDAPPESVAAWLPVAARRLCGLLIIYNLEPESAQEDDDEEAAAQRGSFELPCLERATKVSLYLGRLGLAVPPAGVFSRLTELLLARVRLHGPGDLGDAVSSPRCPCLQNLSIFETRGLDSLAIHSDSLRKVELTDLRGLRQLTIVAPILEDLQVKHCFFYSRSQPVASITAPQLATLAWRDLYDPSSAHLGEMKHLRSLRPFFFFVYDEDDSSVHNQSCLSLLQRFEVVESLFLTLTYPWDMDDYEYVMEDMTMLPDITILHLNVFASRHAFGASAFHVLRMCSGIRKLKLSFCAHTEIEAQTTCPPDCICGEQQNWETEHLLLNRLQEVEIIRLRGSEHEVTFVKQLFNWAASLQKMMIVFNDSVTESMAKELRQVLRSFSRPEICLEIQSYMEMIMMRCIPKD